MTMSEQSRRRIATPSSLRKRKVLLPNTSPRKIRSSPRQRVDARHSRSRTEREHPTPPLPYVPRFRHSTTKGVSYVSWYIFDVVFWVVSLLKFPLTIFLFFYILLWMLGWMGNALLPAFQAVCLLPGSSYLLPICTSSTLSPTVPPHADFPALVAVQSTTFEKMLDESVGGSTLSLEIKKSEIATKDLITLVSVSELKTRDQVAESLSNFVIDARATSEGLQKLSSRVKSAVDG